MLRDHEND